jgi:hypothetical protein
MISRSRLFFVALCFGSVSVGCASKASSSSSDLETTDNTEASASAAQTSRFDQMLFGSVQGQDPAGAASSLVAAQWWPAGCATRAKDASNPLVVHVTLADCSGPFGIVKHSGNITVTFSKSADGSLHAQAASSDMTINGKAVTYSADADITFASGQITIKHDGAWTRENAKGDTVSHTRSGTTVIDLATKCRTTNGTAVTSVASREIDSTIKDYQVCRKADGTDGCPTGDIVHTRKATGNSVTFAFDGSAEATITGPKGNTFSAALVCTP